MVVDETRFRHLKALRDSGRIEEALRESQLMAAETTDVNAKVGLMLSEHTCYCILGSLNEAQRILDELRQLSPDNVEVQMNVDFASACFLIQRGDAKGGLGLLEILLRRYRDMLTTAPLRYLYEDIQQRRAYVQIDLRRIEEATSILKEAVSFSFESSADEQRVHFYLGICHGELGELEAAKGNFLHAINLELHNDLEAQARYRLASLHFRAGAFAQSKYQLEMLIHSSQGELGELPIQHVYEQLSRTCHCLGELEEAKRYLKLARDKSKGKQKSSRFAPRR